MRSDPDAHSFSLQNTKLGLQRVNNVLFCLQHVRMLLQAMVQKLLKNIKKSSNKRVHLSKRRTMVGVLVK